MQPPRITVIAKNIRNDVDNFYLYLSYAYLEKNPLLWRYEGRYPKHIWDKEEHRLKTSKLNPDADIHKIDNQILDNEVRRLKLFVKRRQRDGKAIDISTIKSIYYPSFNLQGNTTENMIALFNADLDMLVRKNNLSEGRRRGYKAVLDYLNDFGLPKYPLSLSKEFAYKFYEFLSSERTVYRLDKEENPIKREFKPISDNSIKETYFPMVRRFINFCDERGCDVAETKFAAPSFVKVKWANSYCLYESERAAFYKLQIPQKNVLFKYWASYMVMSMTGFLQEDCMYLNKDSLTRIVIEGKEYYYIHKTRTKVNSSDYYMPICPMAKYYINILADKNTLIPNIITNTFSRNVKKLAKMAGIDSNVRHQKSIKGQVINKMIPKYQMITGETCRKNFDDIVSSNGMGDLFTDYLLGHSLNKNIHARYRDFKPEKLCPLQERLSFIKGWKPPTHNG